MQGSGARPGQESEKPLTTLPAWLHYSFLPLGRRRELSSLG
jgi:hypothetical protein